jgi:hypothetical protein
MILYRVVKGDRGQTISEDRCHDGVGPALELSHSPEMAKTVRSGWPRGPCIGSLRRVRKSTPFVFISGGIGRGLSTNPSSAECQDIDNTQGEIVLAPMTLKKTDKNVRDHLRRIFGGAANTTRKIVIASLRPQRYLLTTRCKSPWVTSCLQYMGRSDGSAWYECVDLRSEDTDWNHLLRTRDFEGAFTPALHHEQLVHHMPAFSSCIASNNSDEFISPELNLTRSSIKSSYLEIISVCDGPLQMTADATDSMSDSESDSRSDSDSKGNHQCSSKAV